MDRETALKQSLKKLEEKSKEVTGLETQIKELEQKLKSADAKLLEKVSFDKRQSVNSPKLKIKVVSHGLFFLPECRIDCRLISVSRLKLFCFLRKQLLVKERSSRGTLETLDPLSLPHQRGRARRRPKPHIVRPQPPQVLKFKPMRLLLLCPLSSSCGLLLCPSSSGSFSGRNTSPR